MNEFFMEQAIKLALKGKDKVYPNPMVGCVIVKDGKIIARGWHKYFGAPHAEIEALAQIDNKAQGCDLYVTLEPCNSYGKRPPCTQAIIAAGIKRVFFAVEDPSVSHAVETLKSAGIEVFSGLCKTRAKLLLKDFLAHLKLKPKVCIK
ncbi:MAG: bifunctional diaminohydroxyphosphoribosylaminopyrimidine deaminase/5-amino-6-(5-phosphoribosylamino)uracil reductase RibD, partial [Elusimicrobiota bacterium]|nr:bifunctional diaminohydroxyphosphoribosylaminopyrimidine deaminase/5-amino-6-(5-phosphoribosylamino)uracil reductase RibD [Elusimicrobiota bacterium]